MQQLCTAVAAAAGVQTNDAWLVCKLLNTSCIAVHVVTAAAPTA